MWCKMNGVLREKTNPGLFAFSGVVLLPTYGPKGPRVPVHVIRPSDGLQIGFRPKSRFPPIFDHGLFDFNKKSFLLKKVK